MASAGWQERLFGPRLVRCSSVAPDGDGDGELVDTAEALATCTTTSTSSYTGVYFSFANIRAGGGGHAGAAAEALGALHRARRLLVVQVVLWANTDVFGDFERSHRQSIAAQPWFAVPFAETERKARLSRRYRIKVGVPTLVVLDAGGGAVTWSGLERLAGDPRGDQLPWRPRPLHQVLADVHLVPGGLRASTDPLAYQHLPPTSVRGFYFSAHWCPPCRAFTPHLVDMYTTVRTRQPDFEIIFVSSDRSGDSFDTYVAAMPWVAVPWALAAVRAELAQLFAVRGIPTLLLVDAAGHVVTRDARAELQDDPTAHHFPWRPRPVNALTERYAARLHDHPAIVLFIDEADREFGESVLAPAAGEWAAGGAEDGDEPRLQFLVAAEESEAAEAVRDLAGLEDAAPLLVALDLARARLATLPSAQVISAAAVRAFAEAFQRGELDFQDIQPSAAATLAPRAGGDVSDVDVEDEEEEDTL